MKKSDYRKFIIRWQDSATPDVAPPFGAASSPAENPAGPKPGATLPSPLVDDFASIREAVERRYRRLQEEAKPFPSLILIDGGLGQLHAAAQALEKLEIINQPLASIAKPAGSVGAGLPRPSDRSLPPATDTIYVLGQEDDPIRLDRHSPILHLIQQIRDETHRFAVSFHRQRRSKRTLRTALSDIPGIGEATARKLLRRFGSLARIREASIEQLAEVVSTKQARAILENSRRA